MKKICIFLAATLILISAAVTGQAKKITTRLKAPAHDKQELTEKLKVRPGNEDFKIVSDSLIFLAYDKKGSSTTETFFIDNTSSANLSELEIEISYYNEGGKLIHRRTEEIRQQFPAKESGKVDIPTWDKQKSYHYTNSVPSAKGSTPYTVRFRVLSFTYAS